jgi:hypothetical protein
MSCDDGDTCTVDSCAANACLHEIVHGQQVFTSTGALQTFTPNACVRNLTIDAFGAQGGDSTANAQPGGLGAHVKGDFTITSGTVFSVLVGAAGGAAGNIGGGGGGTFVWNSLASTDPYLVAGGGGGAGFNSPGQPGLITQNGGNGGVATQGAGTNGSGGVPPVPVTNWGAGGAGWLSDGAGGGGVKAAMCTLATGGRTPKNGGAPGIAGGTALVGSGGFGGGGGGQGQCNGTGGGGGGGYSGGGGGIDNISPNFTGGGGGGSFNAGTHTTGEPGVHAGGGVVTFSW